MNKLNSILNDLESQVQNFSIANPLISSVSVGWHIEHSCLVIIKIAETISNADPLNYKPKFSFLKQLVFLTGKFPRGKAQAPKAVLPNDVITNEGLNIKIQEARAAIQTLNNCAKNQFFVHPIFGNLNTPKTIQFLGIHTKHHLSIIKDILN